MGVAWERHGMREIALGLRKLQFLGKCHNENLSKAACTAIILAYVTEEQTVYRKRKRSIWTKEW
jgi:hypothetical protein